MRKSLFVFVVLIGFTATGCATGGYLGPNPYPGPLGQVVAGNLALTCPGDYFVGAPINRCLGQLGGNMGSYSSYPMYVGGPGGAQLSATDKTALFCGLGGSGVAMLLDAGLKKTLGLGFVSAASCEVAGAILGHRRNGNDKKVIVTQPAAVQPQVRPQLQGGQSVRRAADGMPVAVGTRPNGSVASTSPFWGPGASNSHPNCIEQGMATLENQSTNPLRVFQNKQPFEVLLPRGQKCAPADGSYTGEIIAMVVGSDGLTAKAGVAPAKPQSLPGLVLVWR